MTPTPSPAAAKFADRAARFAEILDGAADHSDAASPCDGWTVRDVVAHTIDTERDFLAQRDLALASAASTDADLAATWRAHAAAVTDVLARDGVAEQEYDGYFGRTTIADTMADFYGWDLMIHGWDVARASGQEWSISDEEAAALGAAADGWGDALYSEGVCDPAVDVAAGASAGDRLLARLGRDPRWAPTA